MKKINCNKCAYYYITWDNSFPYGCHALDFKTKLIPSLEVHRSSGMQCQYFKAKDEGLRVKKQKFEDT